MTSPRVSSRIARSLLRLLPCLLAALPLAAQVESAPKSPVVGSTGRDEAAPAPRDFVTVEVPFGLRKPESDGLAPEVSAARLDLGRRLFFDTLLSVDRSVSCSSCHLPDKGYADPRPRSIGVRGQVVQRNAPTLLNRYLGEAMMWDGRFETLEEQALAPIENPHEMDLPIDQALERLRASKTYVELFSRAWPEAPIDRKSLAGSIAHFVRHLRIGDSPIDRYMIDGDRKGLNALERRGHSLWEGRAQCWRCHRGDNFTDEVFHATGVGAVGGIAQPGRFLVTNDTDDLGRFKTPTLRGLAFTAPYMHDGSMATLEEVVEFYDRGGNPHSNMDPEMFPLRLSETDKKALVAFLLALSR